MSRDLVIVGNGQMAELFCSQFTHSAEYRVVGFAVDREWITAETLLGLPVVPLDELESRFPPDAVCAFVAIGPVKNNAVRAEKFDELRRRGYRLASRIHPQASVSPDATIGENVVIGAFSAVLAWSTVADNVLLGAGSIVGHHCQLHSHAYLALRVTLAGSVVIGERAFLGVGSTVRDNVTIGAGSVVGAGAVILGDVEPNSVYVPERAKRLAIAADRVRL